MIKGKSSVFFPNGLTISVVKKELEDATSATRLQHAKKCLAAHGHCGIKFVLVNHDPQWLKDLPQDDEALSKITHLEVHYLTRSLNLELAKAHGLENAPSGSLYEIVQIIKPDDPLVFIDEKTPFLEEHPKPLTTIKEEPKSRLTLVQDSKKDDAKFPKKIKKQESKNSKEAATQKKRNEPKSQSKPLPSINLNE